MTSLDALWYHAPKNGGPPVFEYWPWTLLAIAIAVVVEYLSLRFSPLVPGYNQLSPKKKVEWQTRPPGVVFAVIASSWGIYALWFDPDAHVMWEDRTYAVTATSGKLFSFAAGYFAWDVYVCIRDRIPIEYLYHGAVAFVVFGSRLWWPRFGWYGTYTTTYELSTPWLHTRATLLALKKTDTVFFQVAHYGALVVFVTVRLVLGLPRALESYASYYELIQSSDIRDNINGWAMGLACTIMNGLNVFWFFLIVKSLLKGRSKTTKAT
eukprot:m.485689 g.485689  ORF g.485689 m.485689 type:complete len:266 (+) comp23919_c0_seq1:181-978(+)